MVEDHMTKRRQEREELEASNIVSLPDVVENVGGTTAGASDETGGDAVALPSSH
jgi:hypothetical protein